MGFNPKCGCKGHSYGSWMFCQKQLIIYKLIDKCGHTWKNFSHYWDCINICYFCQAAYPTLAKWHMPVQPRYLLHSLFTCTHKLSCNMHIIQNGAKVRTHWPSQAAKLYQRGRWPFWKLERVFICVLVKIFVRADMQSNQIKCKIAIKNIHSYVFSFQVCPDFCTSLYSCSESFVCL
jgi:hypothetical protein